MTTDQNFLLENNFSKKTNRALDQFWAGFVIYTLGFILEVVNLFYGKTLYVQLLGFLLMIIASIRLIKFRIEDPYLRNIFFIYYCWLIFIIIRGGPFDYEYLKDTISNVYLGIPIYLVPLVILFPKDLIYLKKVVYIIFIFSIIYIIGVIVFKSALFSSDTDQEQGKSLLEYFSKTLAIPGGFILFIFSYHNDKRKYLSFFEKLWFISILVLTLLLGIIRARRGLTFMSLNILIVAYLIYSFSQKGKYFTKIFPLLIIFFLAISVINNINENKLGIFSYFTERLNDDTRGPVEDDFYAGMTQTDWIIGRGIDGKYFSLLPGDTDDGMRKIIETDYLQIILKGGIISLGLFLLITIPAVIKGIFYSKNILSKAAALWILLNLINLYPSTVVYFCLNYILLWISVGICYSKTIRNMPEENVKAVFNYKFLNI